MSKKFPLKDDDKDLGRGRAVAKSDARAYDGLAQELFELPETRREVFPGSSSLSRALLIRRENLDKGALRRHLRHIAGLLRSEDFSVEELEAFIAGGAIATADDDPLDIEALRDQLCDAATFDDARTLAGRQLPLLDLGAVDRYARRVHDGEDRRAYASLYKLLRQALDAMDDDA